MRYIDFLMENYRNMNSRTRLSWGIGFAVILILALLYTAANERVAALKKKRASREVDVADILVLKQRYLEAAAASQTFANRMAALRPEDSAAKIVEETGIKGKTSQSKQLKTEDRGTFLEDLSEVRIEGLSANEAINLLYKLEKGAKPVVVKKAFLKTRFDEPAKLDLTLTIAVMKPSPQGQK